VRIKNGSCAVVNKENLSTADNAPTKRFYHGTRADLKPGDLIQPGNPPDTGERDRVTAYVGLSPNLDAAIWEAELAAGKGPGRVYALKRGHWTGLLVGLFLGYVYAGVVIDQLPCFLGVQNCD
jgi:hypothetical protein